MVIDSLSARLARLTDKMHTDIEGWGISPRGAGFLFGGDVVRQFVHSNGLDLIARAHQLVMEGHKLMFDDKLVTVWSAPNYCYRCGNIASILELDENLQSTYKTFDAAPQVCSAYPLASRRCLSLTRSRRTRGGYLPRAPPCSTSCREIPNDPETDDTLPACVCLCNVHDNFDESMLHFVYLAHWTKRVWCGEHKVVFLHVGRLASPL